MRISPQTVAIFALLALAGGAPAAPPVTPQTVAAHYAALVHASYEDTLSTAKAMQRTIDAFVAVGAGLQRQRTRRPLVRGFRRRVLSGGRRRAGMQSTPSLIHIKQE